MFRCAACAIGVHETKGKRPSVNFGHKQVNAASPANVDAGTFTILWGRVGN